MADNIGITQGTGTSIATDDIGGFHHQRIKLVLGNDGISDGDVSTTNPMPTKNQTSGTSTITSVSNAVTSFPILAANTSRKGLVLNNTSATANVFIAFAATATTSAFTIRLTPNSNYNMPQPIYTGAISGIASAANGLIVVTELT